MCVLLICKSAEEYFVWINNNLEINLAMNFMVQVCMYVL